MSLCRSCGAIIDWVELKSGKKMPVDRDYIRYSEAEENDKLVTDDGEVIAVKLNSIPEIEPEGRISHFSTCPQADDWRKK